MTESPPIVALTRDTPPDPPDRVPLADIEPLFVDGFQLLDSATLSEAWTWPRDEFT